MTIIDVSALHKSYRGRPVVDGISFTVEEGEVFGVLGPNGAGKTTTVECVAGLRRPDSGTIRVAGLDPVVDHERLTRVLGVQLQESELQPKITAREALQLFSACYPRPADWRELARRLHLDAFLDTRYAKLSGGQKQRLSIALALVADPRVVILDELTTGLDPRARRDTWQLIEDVRDRGVTVLLVTHFMEEATRLCNRVAVVNDGRVVALDTPDRLAGAAAGATVISFVPSAPVADQDLRALPDAVTVRREGPRLVVHGTDTTVNALTSMLARRQITATALRVTTGTLDDAYLDLTDGGPVPERDGISDQHPPRPTHRRTSS